MTQEHAQAAQTAMPEKKPERGRSTIEWPYFSLDESLKLAKGAHECGGSCQVDQLAGHVNQSASGGAFRLKVQAAKFFGLITTGSSSVSLTELGYRMMEADTEREARAEAFMHVPLYAALYENFKGKTLPGNMGLESAMVNLGVVANQKDKARQTFQRSAREAGFFAYGATKLVYPVLNQERQTKGSSAAEISASPTPSLAAMYTPAPTGGGNGGGLPPFVQGLINSLPAPDSDWPLEARRKWLQSAIGIFDVMYGREDSPDTLTVKVEKSSAR